MTKRVEVTTKPAPRNKKLREVPFMGMNVATIFGDTSALDVPSKYAPSAREVVSRAQAKRERRKARQVGRAG